MVEPEDEKKLHEHRLAKKLAKHPGTIKLKGYIGHSDEPDSVCLYLTLDFDKCVYIKKDDILHVEDAPESELETGGTYIWVKKDADLTYVTTESVKEKASFLEGEIASAQIKPEEMELAYEAEIYNTISVASCVICPTGPVASCVICPTRVASCRAACPTIRSCWYICVPNTRDIRCVPNTRDIRCVPNTRDIRCVPNTRDIRCVGSAVDNCPSAIGCTYAGCQIDPDIDPDIELTTQIKELVKQVKEQNAQLRRLVKKSEEEEED